MTYAVGLLRNVRMGPDVAVYLSAIDATHRAIDVLKA